MNIHKPTYEELQQNIAILNQKISRYQELEHIGEIGLWNIDLSNKIWSCTQTTYTILGINPQDTPLSLKVLLAKVSACDKDLVNSSYTNSISNVTSHEIQYEIEDLNGDKRYLKDSCRVEFCGVTNTFYLKGVIHDVTNEIRAKKETEFYFNTLSTSSNILCITRELGEITKLSTYFGTLFNKTENEYIGKSFFSLFKNKVSKIQKERIQKKLEKNGKYSGEFEFITAEGNKRLIKIKIVLNPGNKNNKNWIIYGKDITRKKEESIRNNRYIDLIKNTQKITHIGGWELDLVTMEPFFTKELFNIYDLPGPDVPPAEEGITYYEEEHRPLLIQAINDAIEKNKPYDLELKFISKKGNKKWVRTMGMVEHKDGVPIKLIGILQDITKRKKMELKVLRNNQEYILLTEGYKKQNNALKDAKDKAIYNDNLKTKFLANLSHEIRTPLNGIVGFSRLLQSEKIEGNERRKFQNIVLKSGEQLHKTLDEILEISKFDSKQLKVNLEDFQLKELFSELFEVFNLQAKEKNLRLFINAALNEETSFIKTDRTRLYRIISNLIQNAIKFTSEGTVEMGYSLESENIHIYVKDSGVGISSGMMSKIFNRFTQEEESLSRKYNGLGLGLSIVKDNADLLKATVEVKSKKGFGSTFILKLPYQKGSISTKKSLKDERVLVKTEEIYNILIAEDVEMNFMLLQMLLTKLNIKLNITRAKNGIEAINHFNSEQDFNLILMDIEMPLMDGFKATEIIRQNNTEIPIIAQTAHVQVENYVSKENGFTDFITKPIEEKSLLSLLKYYLDIENS